MEEYVEVLVEKEKTGEVMDSEEEQIEWVNVCRTVTCPIVHSSKGPLRVNFLPCTEVNFLKKSS